MNWRGRVVLTVLSASSIGFLAIAGGQEKRLAITDLPQAVLTAMQNAFPDAKWNRIAEKDEDDELIFVVNVTKPRTRHDATVQISRTGQVLEIDEDIPTSDLPERVTRAVSKAFPGGTIVHAEQESEMEIIYRVHLTTDGKKREVKLTRRGRILEIEKKR